MRNKFFWSVLVSLLVVTPLFSLTVHSENRDQNFGLGYCAWVSIQVVGKELKIPNLYNISKEREGGGEGLIPRNIGYLPDIDKWLITRDVQHQIYFDGIRNLDILRDNVTSGNGVVVGGWSPLHKELFGGQYHAIVITNIDSKYIYYYDCNYPGYDWIWETKEFMKWWTGYMVIINK